jgi:hypothetical protein
VAAIVWLAQSGRYVYLGSISPMERHGPHPPNGLAFSCGERAKTCFQNANDLAREAVSWNFHDRKRSLLTRETVNLLTVSQKRRVGRARLDC